MTTTSPSPASEPSRDYRITFARLNRRGDGVARRGRGIPPWDRTTDAPLAADEIAECVRAHVAANPPPGIGPQPDVKVYFESERGTWGTVNRKDGGPVLEFHVVWRPARRRGRPPIGPALTIRLPDELRARVAAAALPGESLAETARRLLDSATAPAAERSAPRRDRDRT